MHQYAMGIHEPNKKRKKQILDYRLSWLNSLYIYKKTSKRPSLLHVNVEGFFVSFLLTFMPRKTTLSSNCKILSNIEEITQVVHSQ